MRKIWKAIKSVWQFYVTGFRSMTIGRTLWLIIIVKLFVMFAILRVFFFKPALSGLDTEQKQETVGGKLIERGSVHSVHSTGIAGHDSTSAP